jgi:hypothetical protein
MWHAPVEVSCEAVPGFALCQVLGIDVVHVILPHAHVQQGDEPHIEVVMQLRHRQVIGVVPCERDAHVGIGLALWPGGGQSSGGRGVTKGALQLPAHFIQGKAREYGTERESARA